MGTTTTSSTADAGTKGDAPRVSVIAPAYNESPNLTALVRQLADVLRGSERLQPYEIIIVDDGSTDDTADTLQNLAFLFDEVYGIHLQRNYGQSAALAAGVEHATGEVVVTIDADLQNDPEDIPRLVAALETEGVDCVSGRRRDRADSWHKTVPSAIQTRLAKACGPNINDFGCTLKAYRSEALADIDLYGEGHRYIPAKLYDRGYSIAERDVSHRPRENGQSHYGAGRLVRGFVDLLWHLLWNRYSSRPMHLLGGVGVVLMVGGGLLGAVSVIERFAFGTPLLPHLPRLVLVALLLIFGVQLLIFGALMEFLTTLYYREDREYRVDRVVE